MNDGDSVKSSHRQWAEFRYSVIGHLLAAPPAKGELSDALKELSEKSWRHPQTAVMQRFGFSTIEAWYYRARNEKRDPVGRLRSKIRDDLGKSRRIDDATGSLLEGQYREHPSWAYQLHSDNLKAALVKKAPSVLSPSYPTVCRYMKRRGMRRQRRPRNASHALAITRRETREVRSYEMEYVNALWHLDFHKSDVKVVTANGEWRTPIILGVFDDHSRLACHVQWYLEETAENLVHGFSQAMLKRALPREVMSDNGSQMTGEEFTAGLGRLAVIPKNTLPYSPYQNGKCEHAWTKVDGRLLAMLENYKDLTLGFLNDATQAWVEMEYNRQVHDETKERPIDRYAHGKDVGRLSPGFESLRMAFRREVTRRQRLSDGTIVIDSQRYEIPSRFRTLETVTVRYAFWDLSFVHLLDFRTGEEICRLYPVDKVKNSDGQRRLVDEPTVELLVAEPTRELPALLSSLIEQYRDMGLRPAYLPKPERKGGPTDDSQP